MRQEFEKLKEVAEELQFVDGFDGNKYHSLNNHRTAEWVNGALYAYQEQQKLVDFNEQQATFWKEEYLKKCSEVDDFQDKIDKAKEVVKNTWDWSLMIEGVNEALE